MHTVLRFVKFVLYLVIRGDPGWLLLVSVDWHVNNSPCVREKILSKMRDGVLSSGKLEVCQNGASELDPMTMVRGCDADRLSLSSIMRKFMPFRGRSM